MRILKWVVRIRNDKSNFISLQSAGGYLCGLKPGSASAGVIPVFGADDPVLYSRRSARFLVSELRRAGYNCSCLPFVFVLLRAWIQARKQNPWKK